MTQRLPPEAAFDFYVHLGPNRSHTAVAKQFGVGKRSVTKCASKHGWARRLLDIETKAREQNATRLVDAVAEMNERHLKAAKVIQAKAYEALRNMPLDSAMAGVRALDIGLKQERLILGEPTERSAVAVEDLIKREAARWLGTEGSDVTWESFADPAPAAQPADDDDDEP